ncbi:hypothetical protein ACLOJK_010680 [Asimina triloba]
MARPVQEGPYKDGDRCVRRSDGQTIDLVGRSTTVIPGASDGDEFSTSARGNGDGFSPTTRGSSSRVAEKSSRLAFVIWRTMAEARGFGGHRLQIWSDS